MLGTWHQSLYHVYSMIVHVTSVSVLLQLLQQTLFGLFDIVIKYDIVAARTIKNIVLSVLKKIAMSYVVIKDFASNKNKIITTLIIQIFDFLSEK